MGKRYRRKGMGRVDQRALAGNSQGIGSFHQRTLLAIQARRMDKAYRQLYRREGTLQCAPSLRRHN